MSKAALKTTRATVYRWLVGQSIALIVAALVFWQLIGQFFAVSVIWGGIICIIPTAIFARSWLSYYRVSAAPRLVKVFYIGSMVKLFVIGLLFLLAQRYLQINMLGCLIGFITTQMALWITPLISSLISRSVTSSTKQNCF